MKVAIVLPARLASTRLPQKLLLAATGKTVLEHTLERAQAAQAASGGLITRVLVAADDPKLVAIAQRAGAAAVLTSPRHPSGTERIAEAAANLEEEIIINVQADEPEIDPASILRVASLLCAPGERAPMATLAKPLFDRDLWLKPSVVKVVVSAAGYALYFTRAAVPFVRDGGGAAPALTVGGQRAWGLHHLGLYAYRRAFLLAYAALPPSQLEQLEKLEQLRALEAGHRIRVGLVESGPPGIDTAEDYAAFVARHNQGLSGHKGCKPLEGNT